MKAPYIGKDASTLRATDSNISPSTSFYKDTVSIMCRWNGIYPLLKLFVFEYRGGVSI